jgi:hypothetical protein
MKPDLYTKAVLTVVAAMLVVIGYKSIVKPETTAYAAETFAGLQFSVDSGHGYSFFDPRTGEISSYTWRPSEGTNKAALAWQYRLTKIGDPLTVEHQPR